MSLPVDGLERRRPRNRLEAPRSRIEAVQREVAAARFNEVPGLDESRKRSRRQPLVILFREPFTARSHETGVRLEYLIRPADLTIEIVGELARAPVERLAQLVAVALAHLANPSVLQHAKRDDEHDERHGRQKADRQSTP